MSAALRQWVAPCLMVTATTVVSWTWASAAVVVPQEAGDDSLEVTLLRTWAPEDLTMVDGLANKVIVAGKF